MKIAYFLDSPTGLGGAGNVLLEQAKLMSDMHDVLVIIPCSRDGEVNPEYMRRCKLAHLRYKGMSYSTAFMIQDMDLIDARKNIDPIKKMAIEEKVEFFHSVQLNPAVELASRELGIPHLMNIYQIPQEEFTFTYMDIFPQYHSCDSWLYCRIWEKNLHLKTRCIRPVAPLPEIRKKEREKKEHLNIVMLGRICEWKSQLTAVRAVELCCKKGLDIHLVIAGDAEKEYVEKCMNYVEEKHLQKKVNIIGFQKNVVPLLESSDCYLCTSKIESFPSAIIEAMTYDLTIISTPVAGVPELLKDGENAYLSRGYEPEDIAACILECMNAYKDRSVEYIHRKVENLWEENFSRKTVRQQLDKYYQYIFADYGKKRKKFLQNKVTWSDVICTYGNLCMAEISEPYVLSRCYYYACLGHILGGGKAYIWGAGYYGKLAKIILETLFPWVQLVAYIDEKKRGKYQEVPVISPEEIETGRVHYIFLGFAQRKEQTIAYLEEKALAYACQVWVLP